MYLPRTLRSSPATRRDFEAALRTWLAAAAPGATVGGAGQGQTPWVWVRAESGELCHLNSNTTRRGVEGYLALTAFGQPPAWSVVPNRRGVENKVAFGPERRTVPGFYLYRPPEE